MPDPTQGLSGCRVLECAGEFSMNKWLVLEVLCQFTEENNLNQGYFLDPNKPEIVWADRKGLRTTDQLKCSLVIVRTVQGDAYLGVRRECRA